MAKAQLSMFHLELCQEKKYTLIDDIFKTKEQNHMANDINDKTVQVEPRYPAMTRSYS